MKIRYQILALALSLAGISQTQADNKELAFDDKLASAGVDFIYSQTDRALYLFGSPDQNVVCGIVAGDPAVAAVFSYSTGSDKRVDSVPVVCD